MKYLFSIALIIGVALSASASYVRANDGQVAYNECMQYIFLEEPKGLWRKFPQLLHEKQENY